MHRRAGSRQPEGKARCLRTAQSILPTGGFLQKEGGGRGASPSLGGNHSLSCNMTHPQEEQSTETTAHSQAEARSTNPATQKTKGSICERFFVFFSIGCWHLGHMMDFRTF